MIFATKPILVDAMQFGELDQGHREPWVTQAILCGQIWMRGGTDPYWTVQTTTGTVQMSGDDWLVRHSSGDLSVYSKDEFDSTFEYRG